MAHFAQLDEKNIVMTIIVVNNSDILDENGIENETIGINFCKKIFGKNTNWVQTSYNNNFRKNYASKGFKYDKILDAFIPPSPFPSWILDKIVCKWKPPIEYPEITDRDFKWDENSLNWISN
jgi:hypothetical protein